MEGLELIAFETISNVGMAKSLAIEALRVVRSGNYAEGEERLSEAAKYLTEGHHAHTSLMLMHAEDQMMSAEVIKSLAEEMIEMYKELKG